MRVVACPTEATVFGAWGDRSLAEGLAAKSFPPHEDGQTVSQRKLIVSEASQPAVRIICRAVEAAKDPDVWRPHEYVRVIDDERT